jgi:DNA-directed RNA polymerase I and III subunit RPAC1
MPEIELLEEIQGDLAQKLAACFSPGVIQLIEGKNGKVRAEVACPRNDTISRECFRHPELADKVRLSRIHNHFICKS